MIVVVQPAGGGTVPQDKPVLVFRFAQGEPADPLDVRSFVVSVDGADRTALFQVVAGEAWGPLADHAASPIAVGPHQVTARVCSTRGACAATSATVTVVPSQQTGPSTAPSGAAAGSRRGRLVDFVLEAARKLLAP